MMKQCGLAVGLTFVLACGAVGVWAAEDFGWTFDDKKAGAVAPAAVRKAGDVTPPKDSDPAAATAPAKVSASAYDELLQENMKLRELTKATQKEQQGAKDENARMQKELREMDQRVNQFLATIRKLEAEKQAGVTNRAAAGATASGGVSAELVALRQSVEKLRQDGPDATAGVVPGTDLYEKLQRENAVLREKLVELENERAKAVRLSEQLTRRVDQVSMRGSAGEQELRRQLESLKQDLVERDAQSRLLKKENEGLLAAVEKLERKATEAETVAKQLGQAQESFAQVTDGQKRDMHYNMAAVYAKEGKYAEAEQEYLNALRFGPEDADIHYNLAILYDDDLKLYDKALAHYRRYLKLSPYSPDAAAVKEWVARIEAGKGR